MAEFLMPSLGADMDAGTLLEWYVKSGDAVHRGDIVAVVDTSKAEIEIEIFDDGVIDELLVAEGTRVPVGTVLATVRSSAGNGKPAVSDEPIAPAISDKPVTPANSAEPVAPAVHVAPHEHRLRVSPVARRMAEQLGVDLSEVAGTGPDGAITKVDVERVSHAPAAAPDAAFAAPVAPPAPSAPPTGVPRRHPTGAPPRVRRPCATRSAP
jgi:pyruvate dehydrogenase E2 component (dihydrolipoamide acetyltransferase)